MKQLTTGNQLAGRIGWTADGHILAVSDRAGLLSIDADGKVTSLITGGDPIISMATCRDTNQVVFSRRGSRTVTAYRADSDGSNIRTLGLGLLLLVLRTGHGHVPGQSEFLESSGNSGAVPLSFLSRAPAEPPRFAGRETASVRLSGKLREPHRRLHWLDERRRWSKAFLFPGSIRCGCIALVSRREDGPVCDDSRSRRKHLGATAPGGSPRQITHFPPGLNIRGFDWSKDGKQLAVVRSSATSNVLILADFRQ